MASDPVPTITIGPLSQAIDVAVIEDWLASASIGDELVYAWGAVPPRTLAAWSRARDLFEEREVRLHDRLRPGGRTREWYLVKRRVDVGEQPVAVAAVTDAEETGEAAVLRILRRAVNFSKPCPTNAEIGAQCGLTTRQAAHRVEKLVKARAVTLEDRGPGQRRVLTIGRKSTPAGAL
ncbi:MAG: hypothetical protein OSB00_07770 [Sphingomonas bacterium]|nr:hypothetical protein [Sphingomonas bacterium]